MSLIDHAILAYFDGERREMLSILGASVILATLCCRSASSDQTRAVLLNEW